jgi:multiple sugar transport system permease protein
LRKVGIIIFSIIILIFFLAPVLLTFLYALTPEQDYYNQSKLLPSYLTLKQIKDLLILLGAWKAVIRSVQVALISIILSFILGIPAAYAMVRYKFKGKNLLKLLILLTRTFPLIVVAIPLLMVYMKLNLNDTVISVALAHTSMVLPFMVILGTSVLATIPEEFEEAAMVDGLSRFQAVLRITLPLALPGLTAASIIAFVMSWNEVFVASILTLTNRTLPAYVINTAYASTDVYKFAAGVIMALPAMIFIFLVRKYLVTVWGLALK